MSKSLKSLDGIRGLAALYVMIHHARLTLTQSYHNGLGLHPEKYDWYDKLMVYFFSLFKFGHEAVIVFFVLSGFVIHLKQADSKYEFRNLKLTDYIKKRIIRIYPTLITSFIVCVLVELLINAMTGESLVFLLSKYSFRGFLYNLFLIPDGPIWGHNYPMWSLKHEWFFYIMYPLLLWTTTKHHIFTITVILTIYASYCFGLKIPFIGAAAYTLLIWSLRGLLAYFYKNYNVRYFPFFLIFALIYPLINRESVATYPLLDLVFGFTVMGGIALIISYDVPYLNNLLIKFSWLGMFSYTLYLMHSPLLYGMEKLIKFFSATNEISYHLWYVLLACFIVPPICYVIYYYTERIAINYKRKI
ncbi:MAG: acyltransferase [Pedobacter sp.]|nr:MAG: acyltransferase [Pedobacter sp.]